MDLLKSIKCIKPLTSRFYSSLKLKVNPAFIKNHRIHKNRAELEEPQLEYNVPQHCTPSAFEQGEHNMMIQQFQTSKTCANARYPLSIMRLAKPYPDPVGNMPSTQTNDLEKARQMYVRTKVETQCLNSFNAFTNKRKYSTTSLKPLPKFSKPQTFSGISEQSWAQTRGFSQNVQLNRNSERFTPTKLVKDYSYLDKIEQETIFDFESLPIECRRKKPDCERPCNPVCPPGSTSVAPKKKKHKKRPAPKKCAADSVPTYLLYDAFKTNTAKFDSLSKIMGGKPKM